MVLINELMGGFGKYHLWLCIIIFISKFGIAFHQMAIIFLAPPTDYECPGTNSTCCDNPVFDTSVFKRTMVTEWNLTCNSSWLKDFAQTIFQFGVLCGSLLFGIASDKLCLLQLTRRPNKLSQYGFVKVASLIYLSTRFLGVIILRVYGRRPTLIISVTTETFMGIMSSFLPDYWSFSIGRMIVGIAIGGILTISFVILMEYVGNDNRDIVSAAFHIPFTIGHMLMAAIGYYIRDYMYFQLCISLSTVILLSYICILPETPRWLLVANRTELAIELMEQVAETNGLPTDDIRHKMELYQMEHRTIGSKSSILDLFRKPYLRRNIMIMSFIWLSSSFCFYGMAYYISHLTGDVYINVVASGGVCLCASIISMPLIKFFQRKIVVIAGNILCGFFLLAVPAVPNGPISIAFGCLGVLFCYIVFIVIYLYCSEMFPTVIRNASVGICSMMARVGAMIAPFVANLKEYGQWYAPVAFGGCSLIAAALCVLMPETKGCELMMTIEEGEAFSRNDHDRRISHDVATSTN